MAFSIATIFGYQPVDGILGLGWPSLTSSNTVPPMQNLLQQLDLPLFTVYYKRLAFNKITKSIVFNCCQLSISTVCSRTIKQTNNIVKKKIERFNNRLIGYICRNYAYSANPYNGGQITFGAIDTENCAEDVYYIQLSSKSYWQFTLDGYALHLLFLLISHVLAK